MKLLIDLGNSRLKWGTGSHPEAIETGAPLANHQISIHCLTGLWQHLTRPELVTVASVSTHEHEGIILEAVNQLWPGIAVHKAKAQAKAHGITSAYTQPDKLGVDRWLGMIAAIHKHRKAFCLAGCGTAVTIDIVDNSGLHQGGLIAPGLKLMQHSLATGTANLNPVWADNPPGLASSTDAAIYNGVLYAACGIIEHALAQQSAGLDLILTGGNAELIAKNLLKPALIEPDLVLKGLALTAREIL